jgi:transcriptional regulator with XRE-family HTH domain
MTLGRRIRQERAKRGWNQKQLAQASRISQATISRLEADQVTQLRSDALGRLAEALGVTVDYLVGLAKEPLAVGNPDPAVRELVTTYAGLVAIERQQLVAYGRFLQGQGQRKRRATRAKAR